MSDHPILPLDREVELSLRYIRSIAAGLATHGDDFIRADSRTLTGLADALERSLNHTSGI